MIEIGNIEKLSEKYSTSPADFIRQGTSLALKEKKRNLMREKLEILGRYEADSVDNLKDRIKQGLVPEHPAWEELIEAKNIESAIKEIDSDIETL